MVKNRLMRQLGIELPIVQAPMGGGPTTPELVAAVSNAGGLGSVAGGYLGADQLRVQIEAVRRLTDRPFAVNVFVPERPEADRERVLAVGELLRPLYREVGLADVPDAATAAATLDAQIEVILELRPAVVSFTFGVLPAEAVNALHAAGCVLIGTSTTVAEARLLEDAGIDVVCAQGAEAGAHRGTFLGDPETSLVGLVALVPQTVDAVEVPVVAAGAIMDGRGLAAVLSLGASAGQLGTAFLRAPEAGTSTPHRRALAESSDTSTVVTSALTGKHARGIANRLVEVLDGQPVPPYPTMNSLTSPLRKRAAQLDAPELMSLWAGQGAPLGRDLAAGQLVRAVADEADAVLRALVDA